MTTGTASGSRPRRLSPELREQETVKPLELYFDLVFVLGFTQCTALMAANPSWEAVAEGMLVLAVLWWAWTGYAWLTSVIDPEEGSVRIAFFAAMAGLLVVALCVPEAFDERALAFAIAYAVVRAAHIALFLVASRDDASLRRSVLELAISSGVGVGLLVGASFLDGLEQGGLWVLAIAVDWGGPALFGLAGWRLVPAHFAERHNLVIILALGESIVALGIGANVDLSAGVVAAAVLGVALASAVWWTYFDVVALVTEQAPDAGPGGTRAKRARPRLVFVSALPDGCRDRAPRPWPQAHARACRRSPRQRAQGSRSSAGSRPTCSPTSCCGFATRVVSTSSASCSPSCYSHSVRSA